MSTETYNGWKNYPTWNVKLWLDNHYGLYLEVQDMVAQARIDGAQHGNVPEIWSAEEATRYVLADRLKDWLRDDVALLDEASMRSDLLGYALNQVDWDEIATAYLEDE